MTKYLKIKVSGPYINSGQESYVKLEDDDFDESGEVKSKIVDEYWQNAVENYIDGHTEVMDEADVPEGDRW